MWRSAQLRSLSCSSLSRTEASIGLVGVGCHGHGGKVKPEGVRVKAQKPLLELYCLLLKHVHLIADSSAGVTRAEKADCGLKDGGDMSPEQRFWFLPLPLALPLPLGSLLGWRA